MPVIFTPVPAVFDCLPGLFYNSRNEYLMSDKTSSTERIRAFLVLAATIGTIAFNTLATMGYLNGVMTGEISDKYPTNITPAGYAFSIWSLIYLGLLIFSIYQLLPANIQRFRAIRSIYILSSALNCAWLFAWHSDQIAISFAIIASLLGTLVIINYRLKETRSFAEAAAVKAPFGLYVGWVSAATLVNFVIMLKYLRVDTSSYEIALGAGLLLLAAAFGVFIRVKFLNYLAPLAVAWALTGIAVKQSGKTLIVSAAAVGVVACLIAAASVVMTLKSSNYERR